MRSLLSNVWVKSNLYGSIYLNKFILSILNYFLTVCILFYFKIKLPSLANATELLGG